MPCASSPKSLTRITEFVFVFSINDNYHINKEIVIGKNKQNFYKPLYNFIEAKNNDGSNDLNKATYSTDLVVKLLDMYGIKDGILYDPFMGIGTSAKGAIKYGMNYIGSEISKNQLEYFIKLNSD